MSHRRLHTSRRPGLLGDVDRMLAGQIPAEVPETAERDARGRLLLLNEGPPHCLPCEGCGEPICDCLCGESR